MLCPGRPAARFRSLSHMHLAPPFASPPSLLKSLRERLRPFHESAVLLRVSRLPAARLFAHAVQRSLGVASPLYSADRSGAVSSGLTETPIENWLVLATRSRDLRRPTDPAQDPTKAAISLPASGLLVCRPCIWLREPPRVTRPRSCNGCYLQRT